MVFCFMAVGAIHISPVNCHVYINIVCYLFHFAGNIAMFNIVTTAANFNLERFINSGYGKHISILRQEIGAFRSHEDYSGEEKQKIVLKSLIALTYVKKGGIIKKCGNS